MDRQAAAFVTNYPLHRPALLAVAVHKSFGARNLAHNSAKSAGYFGDALCFLRQATHVSEPQSPVGFFRHISWNRNSAMNALDQNSLGMSFQNILLQVLGDRDERRNLIRG